MKIIKDNEELKSYIVDGVALFNESIRCDFDIRVEADIYAHNIYAHNIYARNIDACNIYADNIDAYNISYYAFCIAYYSLGCSSIEGRRENSIHKCLDGEIEIKKTEINLQGCTFQLSLQELNNLKQQLK